MTFDDFLIQVEKVANNFKNIDKKTVFRVISHLDADGITSAAIIVNALKRLKFVHHLSIVKQLSEEVLEELSKEEYTYYIFTDLGSGQFDLIKKYLEGKNTLILDHHEFDQSVLDDAPKNMIMLNPHSYDIDGSNDISGAGVVYFFTEKLNLENKDHAHLAIIGAIGDVQENNGFSYINKQILDTAVNNNLIKVIKDINWFGIETKPLVKLLNFSNEFEIPDVSGSESSAVMFLESIGVPARLNNEWIKYSELNDDQKKTLVSSILMKRKNLENAQDIFADKYLINHQEQGTPFRDVKEFSTLLNACGRMDKATIGVGACLNDKDSKELALKTLEEYRQEIVSALRWYESNKDSENVIFADKYIIINANNDVRSTIIGTLGSIISNNKDLNDRTIILSMANDEDQIKVSIRVKGEHEDIDLREIINKILETVEGAGGGHKNAAGAILPKSSEKEFFETAKQILENLSV